MAQPTYNPAAKFNPLTTANTFLDWVVTTGALVQQNNDLAANNFYKNTGTLYLNDSILGLQANSAAQFLGRTTILNASVTNLTSTGNLIVSGTTTYQSNSFSTNAGSIYNVNGSYNVYRPYGQNASIRWNETNKYWDLLDVNNSNLSTAYSQILTANLVSSSLLSNSTTTLATSNTVNALYSLVSSTSSGAANSFNCTSGVANPLNGSIVMRGNNGVSIVGTGDIIFINTQQDVTNTATPRFAGLNLTAPLTVSQGGTGANTAQGALTNLLPSTGQVSGYVLSTTGTGQFYWGVGGGGGGGSGGNTITTNRIFYTATGGQTVFTGVPNYVIGSGQLRVYINGVRQYNSDLSESSNTTFTLNNSATSGDLIMAEVDGYTSNFQANNISYTANTTYLSLAQNTIQLGIDGGLGFTAYVWGITNTAFITANAAFAAANAAFAAANNVGPQIAPTSNTANAAFAKANAAYAYANTIASSVVTTLTGTTNQITANAATGNVVISLPQSIASTSNVQFGSIGVGTAPDTANTGSIRAINNITAYYSDDRLKIRLGNIDGALDKLLSLNGFYYEESPLAESLGYEKHRQVGVSAQEVQSVMPEVVVPAPIDDKYLTVQYEKMIPLLIEAIKELKSEVNEIRGLIK